MGTGTVLNKGSWRLELNVVRGFDFEGGHPETKGLDSHGQVIAVPLHRHEVSFDYLRLELGLEYAFAESWGLAFRVPVDIKNQTAEVAFVGAVSPQEREAILNNRDIHHRTETYRGLSDLMLLGTHHRRGLFRKGDALKISAGATLPVGKTEDDPYRLGNQGLEHLHIQFGTGTFDPLIEAHYQMPLPQRLSLGFSGLGRFPFHENRKAYQGPLEVTSGFILGHQLNRRIGLHLNGTVYYQNFAYWSGEKDINSGLFATSGLVGVTIQAGEETTLGFDLRLPLSQRTLSAGDAFKQGPTLLLRISKDL